MLAHENGTAAKVNGAFDSSISADEELDVVREQVALAREDTDPRIEPTLNLSDMESLLNNAFSAESEVTSETDADGLKADLNEDDLLASALFDDEVVPGVEPAAEATAATETPENTAQASLMEELGESFGADLQETPSVGSSAGGHSAPGSPQNPEALNASLAAAQRQQGADTLESIARTQAPGAAGDQQGQRMEVGIIQGMSMLGGAGLAGLAQMLRSSGSTINTSINSRKYGKLSGEVDSLTQNMDGILSKFGANGFMSGMNGLKGEHKAEFVKEFMANPANKQMFDDLLQSVGTLSTKASQAAVAGAAAGLSGDQLDIEINRKIKNVSEKHKEMLDSLQDHNGTKLIDRLNELVESVADFLKSVFTKVAEGLGYNQRPGN